ncbi:MAG: amidohydrolase family protein [Hydrogenophaga sp.]|nr:amidohydrolase family protein [Hydrogenophaga sp.]
MLHAVDCHFHVIGAHEAYPMAADRSYTPEPAALGQWRAVMHPMGVTRGVLVQPSVYGVDNRLLLDVVREGGGQLMGIAAVPSEVSEEELDHLASVGIRGVRLAHFAGCGVAPAKGFVGIGALPALAPRLRARGMHLNLLTDSRSLPDIAGILRSSRLEVVLDHMGRVPAELGANHAGADLLCAWLSEGWFWIKLSGLAVMSSLSPGYGDVRPLHDRLLSVNPERLLWGSDWPHTRNRAGKPSTPDLLASFLEWTSSRSVQEQILWRNPNQLYRFDTPRA